jgi:hypothetical protein
MMERLFKDNGKYTERGLQLDLTTCQVLQKILDENPDVDVRDLQNIFHGAVTDVICMYMIQPRPEQTGCLRCGKPGITIGYCAECQGTTAL